MHADSGLPPNYTIFGEVTDGLDAVDAIAKAPRKPGGEGSSPVSPAKITGVAISES
jgi:cyclophilin family peptidyl-prolyl cis-trans isomerase